MIGKLINFSTRYKVVSNSGSYWDLIGLRELWLNIITEWDNYDYLIFSISNPVVAGWILWDATIEWLKELKKANDLWKPILCLFLDFKTYTNKLNTSSTLKRKYQEFINEHEFEDYKDNWYLLSWTRDIEKCKQWINKQKNWIKFKDENILYFNNMTFRYYWLLNINNQHNWKICYIGNGRWWDRNKFLSRFEWFDIYWRRKEKQIKELNHNFLWLVKQTEVKTKMNQYFWHIVTYDEIWINHKVDVTRLVYTVAAWCLPLIDSRLKYLNLPEEFNPLFIDSKTDIERILNFDEWTRYRYIENLRTYFNKILDKDKEIDKIYNIINKYNENK